MPGRLFLITMLSVLTCVAAHAHGGHTGSPDGRWNLLVLRVEFGDAPGTLFSTADFRDQWVPQLRAYFSEVSNQQLDLRVTTVDPIVPLGARRYYHSCNPSSLLPHETPPQSFCRFFASEAADAAVDLGYIAELPEGLAPLGGGPSDVFDGILVVTGSPNPYPVSGYGLCGSSYRSWWFGRTCVSRDNHRQSCTNTYPGRYEAMIAPEDGDRDCSPVLDPVDDVGPAMQELAHGIAYIAARNAGHPSGYNNNFELLDRCLPCVTGAYTRASGSVKGSNFNLWFPGWLPDAKIVSFEPATGGGTEVLAPIELDPDDTVSPLALRVGAADGTAYWVECRRRISWDSDVPIPDEGVLITRAMPNTPSEGEVTVMIPPGGTLSTLWDKTLPPFQDTANDVNILIGDDVGDGCTVTVDYGPASLDGVPDVGLTPWLTPPLETWETIDIWVDSSCNRYEEGGGQLRYGRDLNGDVVGNGDDACANAENRVYARIRNYGTASADDVIVDFYVTDPLGVGIREASGWTLIGTADFTTFPDLTKIPAGGEAEVWVNWTPTVPSMRGVDRFPFHSCLQVKVRTVTGERVISNQDGDREQENIGYFEARRNPFGTYRLVEEEIDLVNPSDEGGWFWVVPTSEVPTSWNVDVAGGQERFWLDDAQVRPIPIRVQVPAGTPPGMYEFVKIEGFHKEEVLDGMGQVEHYSSHPIGGMLVEIHTVNESSIQIDAFADPAGTCAVSQILVDGCLSVAEAGHVVAITYTDPFGDEMTQTAETDPGGCFSDGIPAGTGGPWEVLAFWHGDDDNASVSSEPVSVSAADPDDLDCDGLPNAQDNCVETSNPNQVDSDFDGFGDLCDCAPGDPDTWAMPPEVTGLGFVDAQTFNWDPLDGIVGPGVVYDVHRGLLSELPVGSGAAETCDQGLALAEHTDTDVPPQGEGFWYLARGDNACATGTAGFETDTDERFPICP